MKTGYFPLKNLLLEVVDILVKFNFFLWVLGLALQSLATNHLGSLG